MSVWENVTENRWTESVYKHMGEEWVICVDTEEAAGSQRMKQGMEDGKGLRVNEAVYL